LGHWLSVVHAGVQVPATQTGVEPLQSALVLQPVPGLGSQTFLLLQVVPVGQAPLVPPQLGSHLPSAQTSFDAHWLENLHTVVDGSQDPDTHTSPVEQSEFAAHGQGPLVPPQVTQSPL
jgi:hypothetical protein